MNWLDQAVLYVAPQAGLNRIRSRMTAEFLSRKYEGASNSKRTSGWRPGQKAPAREVGDVIHILRNRARDLVRNNPFASRGVQVITNNTIGTGIVPDFQAANKSQETEITARWREWGKTKQCDADGLHNYSGLQRLVMRTTVEAGECLVRRRFRRSSDGLALPLQLQVLEPDHIDTYKNEKLSNGGRIVNGIEYSAIGKKIAYWLFKEHPGSDLLFRTQKSVRVPANQIIHHFRVDRAGQNRGASWYAPIIIRARNFDEFEDAELLRQKIAACFSAFIIDGDGDLENDSSEDDFLEKMQPALITRLGPGKDVKFGNPPKLDGYVDYSTISLRAIATGLGVTYEALSGDYSKVNFSSGRMGWLEFHRSVKVWQHITFIPQFCDESFSWVKEAADLTGLDTRGLGVLWTTPAREMIDPGKEVEANKSAIRSGQKTLSECLREQGKDPGIHFDQIAAERKKLKELGIVVDSDPNQTTSNGQKVLEDESA